MTKQVFLSELNQRLTGLNQDLIDEICSDFSAHFNEGLAKGLTEDEICHNLGQPSSIAEQFLEEYGVVETPQVSQLPPLPQIPPLPPIPSLPQIPPLPPLPQQVVSQESAYRNADGMYVVDIEKCFTDVRVINIALKSSQLNIIPAGQTSEIRVCVKGLAKHDRFQVECQNGELSVTENAVQGLMQLIFSNKNELETTIYLPERYAGAVYAQISNGKTEVKAVSGSLLQIRNSAASISVAGCRFDTFDLHASAGHLSVRNCEGGSLRLKASAGNVTVENCIGTLDAHSSAGNVTVDGHQSPAIDVKSSAGNIRISRYTGVIHASTSAGNLYVECEGLVLSDVHASSSAGSVVIKAKEANNLDISASASDVKVYLDTLSGDAQLKASAGTIQFEARNINGNIDANVPTGTIVMRLPDDANCRIDARSRMGSVKQNIRGNEQSPYTLRATTNMGTVAINRLD